MGRESRRHLGLDLFQRVIDMCRGQAEKHSLRAFQQLPAALHCDNGVLKRSSLRIRGNGFDLSRLFRHAAFESGHVMRILDQIERRHAVGQGALGEKGIRGFG